MAATAPDLATNWRSAELAAALGAHSPGAQVEVLAEATSTNTLLMDRYRAWPSHQPLAATLLVAVQQTAGRGRLGRTWQSRAGDSLTFSLALPMACADWSGLSLAVGVALAEALNPVPAAQGRIGLKWPNDLWWLAGQAPGRKLGGILIETLPVGARRVAVVGVGLNVAPQPVQGVDTGVADLQALHPGITAAQALHSVAPALLATLRQFDAEGFAPWQARYAARDVLQGRSLTTTSSEAPEGLGAGVDATGALLVQVGPQLHRLTSTEVSVRPQPTDAAPPPAV